MLHTPPCSHHCIPQLTKTYSAIAKVLLFLRVIFVFFFLQSMPSPLLNLTVTEHRTPPLNNTANSRLAHRIHKDALVHFFPFLMLLKSHPSLVLPLSLHSLSPPLTLSLAYSVYPSLSLSLLCLPFLTCPLRAMAGCSTHCSWLHQCQDRPNRHPTPLTSTWAGEAALVVVVEEMDGVSECNRPCWHHSGWFTAR